ncbi:IS3 family transposase, partial [Aestuariivita sp.]|uniref:IS3 family transposase n=1 Tax=Aestuariivita sp. TaxID=1872407 RepID=UPI0025C1D9F7
PAFRNTHKCTPPPTIAAPKAVRTVYPRMSCFKVPKSCKCNCGDNAACETFFKTIKAKLIWRRSWDRRRQAERAIFEYINGFYNPRRSHSALRWKSPVAFERKLA